MIQPAYVTFDQAKWVREKDFEVPFGVEDFYDLWKFDLSTGNKPGYYDSDIHVYAPEQWRVVEWLRVNHGIWVVVDRHVKMFCFSIQLKKVESIDSNRFKSPQEAYSAAFDYIKDNNLI